MQLTKEETTNINSSLKSYINLTLDIIQWKLEKKENIEEK